MDRMWNDRKWRVLLAITLVYVFLNISAFNTLGVVLATMVESLQWSFTAAGFSYTVLGVACGLGSVLPAYLLSRVGAKLTVAIGCGMLVAGFILCTLSSHIFVFYVGMMLVGVGFAASGNIPAVWIISAWFPERTPRIIGLYMMAGAGGSIIAPPLVQAIVAANGWRFHWGLMAFVAVLCLVLVIMTISDTDETGKEPAKANSGAPEHGAQAVAAEEWNYGEALKTPAFALMALAVALLLTAVTTISAVGVSHLSKLGASVELAAYSLGFFALVGTLAKGAAGPLCERYSTKHLLAIGAVLQGAGLIILAGAGHQFTIFLWGLVFGTGWGITYVATTVILLEYFGRVTGAKLFAYTHVLATVAAFGPLAAGAIADQYGTFAPIFYVCGSVFIASAAAFMVLKKPVKTADRQLTPAGVQS